MDRAKGSHRRVDEWRGVDVELVEAESGVDPTGAELSAAGCPLQWHDVEARAEQQGGAGKQDGNRGECESGRR
jgi:hypothetical protein